MDVKGQTRYIDDILLVVYGFYFELFNKMSLPETISDLAFDIDVYSRI